MKLQFDIRKGLDLPIAGAPRQTIEPGPAVRRVALLGDDYIGMKPTMEVQEGDFVQKGQLLLSDKKTEGVLYTSPLTGNVVEVNRGAKRKFESIVIEAAGEGEYTFHSYPDSNLAQLDRQVVQDNLVQSGLWPALRTRPFSKVPPLASNPHAIFVTAIDTSPCAPDPAIVLQDSPAEFTAGLQVLSTLTEGVTYLCKAYGATIPGEDLASIEVAEFAGPHPAGLAGTHIHLIAPATIDRPVWYVGYQDVVAIGQLFLTGQVNTDRVVAIAGPAATNPRLVRTNQGVCLSELLAGETNINGDRTVRMISGSVFGGRTASGTADYLGRYAVQASMIVEGNHRDLVGWMGPGFNKYSIKPIFASSWISGAARRFGLTSSTEGSHRAIVPMGMYEKVMPLDILPTPLLKALAVKDSDTAQLLGCLELDEEDLSLCTFVCPGKIEYGPLLRECLTTIEHDG